MPQFMFTETPDSRASTGNPPTLTLKFRASGPGTEDEAFVHAMALQATPLIYPTIYGNLIRDDVRLEPQGYQLWHVSVPYVKRTTPQGSWSWSFDTTGGSFHIKASKQTVNRFGTAPDCKQLIGVHDDEVEGTDIVIPALKITVTFKHPLGVVTLDYASFIADITGTVNSARFLRRNPGEVLFLGGTGSDGTQAEAEVTYQFAVQKSLQNQIVGAISGVNKEGWDVAWIRWKDASESGLPVKQPQGIYIERVYDRIDLGGVLGFGF